MEKWFGKELIQKWETCVTIDKINSNGSEINLEVYDTGKKDAVTIVFSHGIAGYARVLLPFTMPLFELGYNLVVPDLQGYGYNKGTKGDFEWNAHKQNLKDSFSYAKKRFGGKVVLGGASMGGPLAYSAACEVEDVHALVCWCLWDLNDKEFIVKETMTRKFTYSLLPLFRLTSKFFGNIRIKTYGLVSYDTLTDSDEFNEMIKKDPQAGTHITLKGAASLILQSKPIVPHERFTKPVLIVQPEKDEMTPKYYTEKVFERLGSAIKKYVLINKAAHFPIHKRYYQQWVNEVDEFISKSLYI